MSAIDDVLRANREFAKASPPGEESPRPRRRLVVVACMDARLSVERALGIEPGDAHVLRNAGGIVTGDMLRSLVLSHHALGTREVMIVNHTDCGLSNLREEEFREQLRAAGCSEDLPSSFHAFSDVDENVRDQIRRLRGLRWTAERVTIRGFVYDVLSHVLREVSL